MMRLQHKQRIRLGLSMCYCCWYYYYATLPVISHALILMVPTSTTLLSSSSVRQSSFHSSSPAFSTRPIASIRHKTTNCPCMTTGDDDENNGHKEEQQQQQQQQQQLERTGGGDPIREATGIRPSLHPTTINAIADALKIRSQLNLNTDKSTSDIDNDNDEQTNQLPRMVFQVSDNVQPIDIALTASTIASKAITKRQQTTSEDKKMKYTTKEEQTIAGRIIGVIMRLEELESALIERVGSIEWIQEYNEHHLFGIIEEEINNNNNGNESNDEISSKLIVDTRIINDPLFCMNRAECMLGLFLHTVEIPQLRRANETVPDNSKVDFLDSDRYDVLIN